MEKILAIDIGYGETKGQFEGKNFTFRSGFAPYRKGDVPMGSSYGISIHATLTHQDGRVEEKNLGPFIVGDISMLYPNFTEPVGNERLGTDNALVLLGEALLRAGVYGDVILSTGAPLDLFSSERENARRWKGLNITVTSTNGKKLFARIVDIVTQPQGVAAAVALEELNLLPKTFGIAVVIDIGAKTTDVVSIALTKDNMDAIRPLCFSIPVGVGDLFNRIGEGISKDLGGFRPQRGLIQAALGRETFSHSGKTCNLAPIEQEARESTILALSNEIRRRFGEQIGLVISIAVVGGGAKDFLLGRVVDGLFPGAEIIPIDSAVAPYMNAAGYYCQANKIVSEPVSI